MDAEEAKLREDYKSFFRAWFDKDVREDGTDGKLTIAQAAKGSEDISKFLGTSIQDLVSRLDKNGNGYIEAEEYAEMIMEFMKLTFKRIDKDSNGSISIDEFKDFLKGVAGETKDPPADRLNEFFNRIDVDRNGRISFREFFDAFAAAMKNRL